MAKKVTINMNPGLENAPHVGAYWQRDDNFVWQRKNDDGSTTAIKTGMRLCKYRSFELCTDKVVGIAERYDNNSTIKLDNGDQITMNLTAEEVKVLLGWKKAA